VEPSDRGPPGPHSFFARLEARGPFWVERRARCPRGGPKAGLLRTRIYPTGRGRKLCFPPSPPRGEELRDPAPRVAMRTMRSSVTGPGDLKPGRPGTSSWRGLHAAPGRQAGPKPSAGGVAVKRNVCARKRGSPTKPSSGAGRETIAGRAWKARNPNQVLPASAEGAPLLPTSGERKFKSPDPQGPSAPCGRWRMRALHRARCAMRLRRSFAMPPIQRS
jgi:hypothetical protein